MRQRDKQASRKVRRRQSGTSAEPPDGSSPLRRRSASCSKACAVRTASPSSAARRASPRILYYRWSKEFLEAGKKRLAGDTAREATSDEVKTLRAEARQLKEALAEVTLENRLNDEFGGRGFESFPARHDFNGLGFKLTSLSSGYPQTIEACDGVRWGGAKAGASKFRVRRCTRVVG